jgi:hypothetical protein
MRIDIPDLERGKFTAGEDDDSFTEIIPLTPEFKSLRATLPARIFTGEFHF